MHAITQAHSLSGAESLAATHSTEQGLSEKEAAIRLADGGENVITTDTRDSLLRRLYRQIADPMIIVLLAAALLSALLNEWADSLIIIAVVLLNSVLGVIQEGKAARAAAALADLSAPQATVRRAGSVKTVSAAQLVVGDIVLIAAGDIVPADMRLLQAFSLLADESSLTGESVPAEKTAAATDSDAPLAERSSMLHMGAPICSGRGEGVVTACGMDTQIGRVAALLHRSSAPPTPLQRRLSELSRVLSRAVLAVCAIVFLLQLTRGASSLLDSFLLAVSLAVAAIPEGLVVVVTLVLSLGMTSMSRQNAIVRRLSAVESLGAVRVIVSDKTGTLTQNKMRVTATAGAISRLARVGALCHSLRTDTSDELQGDPTELALAHHAIEQGISPTALAEHQPLVAELPFDSQRKLMSVLRRDGATLRQYSKGAFEPLIARCDRELNATERVIPLTEARRRELLAQAQDLAAQGLRVLAAAEREGITQPSEEKLVYLGIWGVSDPPRPEVKQAVAEAAQAGVITVMASGDNIATAAGVARELGLLQTGQEAISGDALAAMDDAELRLRLPRLRVYARVTPEDKLRIVRAWQQRGCVTAMTGDGVNDAPALAAADIGVSMGLSGAEVSRQASSLMLADDNYATIVAAVREGRRVYDNIRRAVQFLLSSNLAEVAALLIASLLGLRLFLPVQLLWINLITDCLPAVALAQEQLAPQAMQRPPRARDDSLFAQGLGWAVLRQGAYIAALTLLAFSLGQSAGHETAVTMAFLALSAAELFHAWNMRSRTLSIFRLPSSNRLLAVAIVLCCALNLLLIYLPPAAAAFSLLPLTPRQLLTAALCAFAIVPLVEAEKHLLSRKRKQ